MKAAWLVLVLATACTQRNPLFSVGLMDAAADRSPAAPDAAADRSPDAASQGVTATYYAGANFETQRFTRIDSIIDFAWGNSPPDPSLPFDGFTVRWTGRIRAAYSERYTFTVHSSDGSRLWVNGRLVIDDWRNHAPEEYSGTIDLQAGGLYDIRLEYFHNTGWAVVRLSWQSTSQREMVVPASAYWPE
jgi:PA14 domain